MDQNLGGLMVLESTFCSDAELLTGPSRYFLSGRLSSTVVLVYISLSDSNNFGCDATSLRSLSRHQQATKLRYPGRLHVRNCLTSLDPRYDPRLHHSLLFAVGMLLNARLIATCLLSFFC